MKGKDKCKILKELRAQIAAANDIEWVTENCTHKGECRGTCPKCEAEVAMLERALERRKALGKTVAVTGLAVGMMVTSTSCSMFDQWQTTAGKMTIDQTTAADRETANTSQSVTEEIIVDDLMGDMALTYYYYNDFTLCQSRTFESTKKIYFDGIVDSDGNHTFSERFPEGIRFEIVGETVDMWLILYENSYYCAWKDTLDEYAREVQTETAEDSGDITAENGGPV